jgi:ribosomal protein L11 methyltransferase
MKNGKNFEAIDVEGNCHVRLSPKTDAEFDILIEPKMSFGTGHHETTHMMIQHLLETEVRNENIRYGLRNCYFSYSC